MADERAQKARRGLLVFGAVLTVLTAVIEGAMIREGTPVRDQTELVLLLMWAPAVASLVARLILREGVADVSFGLRVAIARRSLVLAWLHPLAVGAAAYGGAWALGLATFSAPPEVRVASLPAPAVFALLLPITLTFGAVLGLVGALGEEIGWRGYMLTRLIDAKLPWPVAVSGAVWGLWHLPLIIAGIYAAGPRPWLSALLFLCGITAASFLYARVRLVSGSVWPAALAHSSWNAVIQGPFDKFFGGDASRTDNVWIGESGVLTVLALAVLAVVVGRGDWSSRSTPGSAAPS